MAEYIDRDDALSEIERREALMVGDKRVSVDAMKSFIKNRPAADVAPVVHGLGRDVTVYQGDRPNTLITKGAEPKGFYDTLGGAT